ncbi:MAG TPA: PLP-dependent transferase, partial [Thermoanaerobaculia bacterium]|nr:PLP-dependent transferase [Thermoanaerobaculia bacterium]
MAAATTAPKPRSAASAATRALEGARSTAFDAAPLAAPIYQTTTYAQAGLGGAPEYAYSRVANPTVAALERALATLEGGAHALAFASGMAATATLAASELAAGDHVVCSEIVYGGTARLLDRFLAGFGVATSYVDTTEPGAVRAALRPETQLVLV